MRSKHYKLSLILSGAILASCQATEEETSETPQLELSEVESNQPPEYIIVRADDEGNVDLVSSEKEPVDGAEFDVATGEESIFSEASVVSPSKDGESVEGSQESYFYGSRGRSCYRVSARYGAYGVGYQSCEPVYRRGNYSTYFSYVGRSYHKPTRRYYNRYRRAKMYYWQGQPGNYVRHHQYDWYRNHGSNGYRRTNTYQNNSGYNNTTRYENTTRYNQYDGRNDRNNYRGYETESYYGGNGY